MDASDQHLIRDFLAGKQQAFRQLSERHMNLVYGVAMRNIADPSIAEEVVQDVFVLLAKKAQALANHPSLAGWLHNTSRNIAREARRKRLGHQKKLAHFANEASINEPATAATEHLDEIDTAVDALPKKEREAILLRFFEDRDYREIADQLSISEPAARKRVSRGVQRLHSGLRTQLTAGTALALVAPAYLNDTVAASIASTAAVPLASSAGSTLANVMMTKTTATIGCSALLIGSLAFVSIDQNQKRKRLAAELAALQEEVVELRQSSNDSDTRLTAMNGDADSVQAVAEQKTVQELEEELSAEKAMRKLAEEDAATLREATAGLEDEVVLSFGKVEQIGADFGSIFKEARALSEIEKAGELDSDENKQRMTRFLIKASSIGGLSKQIIEFDNEPEEGSKFLSSSYKAIFDLDADTTSKLEEVFATQLAIAKERELTLPNNPAFEMLNGDTTIQESDIKSWLAERQELYGKIRQQIRDEFPADKLEEFDRTVEEGGLGFTNLKLNGSPLGFSLGGKQE